MIFPLPIQAAPVRGRESRKRRRTRTRTPPEPITEEKGRQLKKEKRGKVEY